MTMTNFLKLLLPSFACAVILLAATPQELDAQSAPAKRPTALEAKKMRAEALFEESHQKIAKISFERDNVFRSLSELHVTSSSFPEIMRMLQTQRIQLTIDLAGIEAVEDKLMKQSAESQLQESEEVIETLKENVELYGRYFDAIEALRKQGTASQSDVMSRKLKLNEAKVKLARATAPRKTEENDELSSVAIEKVQKLAKLNMIEKLLAKYYRGRPVVESLKQLDSKMETELSRQAQIERMIDELSMSNFGVNEKD
jgi:hypothetical protein